MKSRLLGPALFVLLTTTSTSWAAATPEQAAEILKSFQTYLGPEPGVITVTPAGDGYDVALDFAPYLKKVETPGFTAAVDPYRFKITELDGGKWAYVSSGPYKASMSVPGTMSFDMSAADVQMEGTYDSNIFSFLDSKYSVSKFSVAQINSDPESKIVTNSTTVVDSLTGSSVSKDIGNGLADSDGVLNFTGATTSTKIDVPPEMAAMMPILNYTGKIASGEYKTKMTGLAAKPVMELVAWAFAHPSKELVLKDQAELKEKLLAALPFFNNMNSVSTFADVSIESGYGVFNMASAGADIGLNGAVKDGRFAESFSMSGFKMPDNLLPPWTKGLVPTTFKFGFDVTDFDMDTPARKFITEMDLAQAEPVPPGSEAAYMAAFAPKNSIQFNMPAGEISSDLYSITYESTSTINFAGLPQVAAKIRMTGLDAVITQLQQAASDPMAQQGMAMLFAAKGVSKQDGDGVVWDITVSPDGKALVNGTDLSAMMGAIAPPPQQ